MLFEINLFGSFSNMWLHYMKENKLDVTRFKKQLINNKDSVLTYVDVCLLLLINSVSNITRLQ